MEGVEPSTPRPIEPKRKQLHPLTAMRAFAAFWVFVCHFKGSDWINIPYAATGQQAVTLFFILSGFLMVYCYNHCTFTRWTCIMDFWWRRIARICPGTIFSFILCFLPFGNNQHSKSTPTAGFIISSFFFVNTYLQCVETVGLEWIVSWSVCNEMFFYLMFPLCFLCMRYLLNQSDTHSNRNVRTLFWWCMWVILPLLIIFGTIFPIVYYYGINPDARLSPSRPWCWMYYLPQYRILQFLAGMWSGLFAIKYLFPFEASIAPNRKWVVGVCVDIVVAGFVASVFLTQPHFLKLSRGGTTLTGTILVLALSLDRGIAAKILSLRPLTYLGEVSFQFYLVHSLPMSWFVYVLADPKYKGFRTPIVLAMAFAMAVFCHHIIEKPCYTYLINLVKRRIPHWKCDCKKNQCNGLSAHGGEGVSTVLLDNQLESPTDGNTDQDPSYMPLTSSSSSLVSPPSPSSSQHTADDIGLTLNTQADVYIPIK